MVYTTKSGDTWDSIAYKLMGDENLTPILIEANQAYIRTIIFKSGVNLVIPQVKESIANDNLPPWKVKK